ncbi:MAG TPA: DUF4982 domain-containing protein, partial [Pyrinomonadaceae bacterium]|nr:DUF4982 domain-containing protein [Pyrinomonadaceae bacterium]
YGVSVPGAIATGSSDSQTKANARTVVKNIYVVSNADKVELFINGKSQGFGAQSNRFLFTFKDISWQPGTVSAIGYDGAGRKISEDQKQTAGEPVAIRLTPRTAPLGLRADGADVALVDVEVVDAKGQRCPTALNLINFTLSGPAEWRGGIAQGPDNYILATSLPVENGVNRIIIRSTTQAGRISLRATADGLGSAAIDLVSHPVSIANGVSLNMPDAGLLSYLTRGPTPAATGLKFTRQPVLIISASAGANSEKANQSFDDNETTEWVSDGNLKNGWIKYEFARAAPISEVTLKLANWRTRSYPIRIMVDDKPVYAGETPRSLGYVTLTFPPVTGRSLKIELAGRPIDVDAFGQIIEVTGKKDTEAAAEKDKGTLSIVEIEIYAPALHKKSY